MNKKEAKEKIKILIDKYEAAKASSRLRSYTEEDTKNGYIMPLFEALGWDFSNKEEVSAEESMSAGRVDYGFYLNGRIKFYLEAKKLSADLHSEDFANQAIRYSWNKGATWAILTDFESIIVFNAQDIKRSLADKLYFEISYDQHLERFEQLWLLSKESFENDSLNKNAEAHGKKFQKIPVTSLLYEDLEKCRDMLTKDLGRMNDRVSSDLLDEGVQKLLDRLIFIRVAEDRGVEDKILIPLVREARLGNGSGKFYESMVKKFREFDDIYNSNLFSPHPFEQWDDYNFVTEKVINILYGKQGYYEYDFKAMPADVLGAVYESYLGHRLTKSKKGLTVAKDAGKRKEHGIYYTPSFIVDYIVKNALGPVLDSCRSVHDLKKIKVLDPACGSGSFLIKAFNMIAEKYKIFGAPDNEMVKIQILEENIYGVDLDSQAVEITRLNLLINALNERMKLPLLDNIKNGNSLISGTDEELEKYFGKNFRNKKPFNWEEEFPEVFKQGGFDVIIGNPPYLDSEEMVKSQGDFREYAVKVYGSAKGNWDLFCIFIDQGLRLLKKEGILSLIVPNKLLSAKYAEAARKVLEENKIILLRDYSNVEVFEASVYPIVFVVQKESSPNNNVMVVSSDSDPFDLLPISKNVNQQTFSNYKDGWAPVFANDKNNLELIDKIVVGAKIIGNHYDVHGAATVGEAYELKKLVKEYQNESKYFKLINTGTIDRYFSKWGIEPTRYIKDSYQKPIVSASELEKIYPKRYKDSISPKIIVAGMAKRIEAFLDLKGEYLAGKSTTIINAKREDLKFLLALLNSKFITFVYAYVFKSLAMQGGYLRIGSPQVKQMPLPQNSKPTKSILNLVNKMLKFNKELRETTENSEKWIRLKSEIEKTDKKIDQLVYKLYGLTPEEIKIIENQEI